MELYVSILYHIDISLFTFDFVDEGISGACATTWKLQNVNTSSKNIESIKMLILDQQQWIYEVQ